MLVCDSCWNDGLPQVDHHFALGAIQGQALARDWSSRCEDELQIAEYTCQGCTARHKLCACAACP